MKTRALIALLALTSMARGAQYDIIGLLQENAGGLYDEHNITPIANSVLTLNASKAVTPVSYASFLTLIGAQASGNYITALTGDATASGPGSVALTLATVATAGTSGSSTAIPVITIDVKGRTTSITTTPVIAPAGTLTGTTLASNVVSSSITGVGTLTSGATGSGFTVDLSTSTITGTLAAARLPAFSGGDVTSSAGSAILTIANSAVTNAKQADMVQDTFKGRPHIAGTGAPVDMTATQATEILNVVVGDSGAGGTKGLVPAPSSGDAAAGKFLKASGAWVAPPGTGDVTGPAGVTDDAVALFNGTSGKIIKQGAFNGTGNVVRTNSPALVTPDLGVATATSINGVGLSGSGTLTIGSGGTLGTAAYTPTTDYVPSTDQGTGANKLVKRDSNGNAGILNTYGGLQTFTTAGGNTTIAAGMPVTTVQGTGTLNQNVLLPAESGLVAGQKVQVVNNSTGIVTLKNSANTQTLATLSAGFSVTATNLSNTGTVTTDWIAEYDGASTTTGTGAQVYGTSPTIATATLSSPTMTTPVLGTPTSGNLANCTFPTLNQNTTGYASALKSATTTVDVAAATAPSANQVLRATSSTAATWQTLNGSTAWVKFDGTSAANLACTYSRTLTTVTVTSTAHGHLTGHVVFIDFTSGGALDGLYTITGTPTADTYTVTTAASGTIAAGSTMNENRRTISASSNVHSVTYEGTGLYYVNFTTAQTDANYAIEVSAGTVGTARFAFAYVVAPTAQACHVRGSTTGLALVDPTHYSVTITR